MNVFTSHDLFQFASGLIGLLFTFVTFRMVCRHPGGSGRVAEIASAIRLGAGAFLRQEYSVLSGFVAVVFLVLALLLDLTTALAFLGGAVCSAATGFIGMHAATHANVRCAVAARDEGASESFMIAIFGGSVMGLAVASIGLLGLSLLYFLLRDDLQSFHAMTGFGMGASLVALFARVGGGIYTKSADVGADLVGKIETGIPEDDPRNPGVIADNVGDNVGDVAGMGADIFESYCGAIIAAIAVAATASFPPGVSTEAYMTLPLSLAACGLLASLAGLALIRLLRSSPVTALRCGVTTGILLFIGLAWLSCAVLDTGPAIWATVLAGAIGAIAIGSATEYYTELRPVRELSDAGKTGPATVIIAGLALGMRSTLIPILALGTIIFFSTWLAGLYGAALAAVGMLSTVGIVMAIDAYGPIADNAGGIAQMSGMGDATRAITDQLDMLGNTTAAIGKGFSIGAATLTALALISAYVQTIQQQSSAFALNLADPEVLVGLFLGGMLPFLFAALTMTAVADSAAEMIVEIRRQFREIPGLLEGTAQPDHIRCTTIATRAALKRMIVPGCITVLSPLLIGFGLGPNALGGMLAGALLVGVLLALTMANAGGAWDNAKKLIEQGRNGGKGSDAHHAAVVGDTVGDPFKDTSGPALNILIKVIAIISLLIAPYLGA